jgi:hypothetical protein
MSLVVSDNNPLNLRHVKPCDFYEVFWYEFLWANYDKFCR